MAEYALKAKNITKTFPGVIANQDVSLSVKYGEIHGLIGENGAGKSTILKVLTGVYPCGTYSGTIAIDNEPVKFQSTYDAKLKGVGFVPQEINVLENMTVGENIVVGDWKKGREKQIGINFNNIYSLTGDLLKENGINLKVKTKVGLLSVGQKQLLMLGRALYLKPKVLILDEPTTSLTLEDVQNLFDILVKLKKRGVAIIFVTHKLDEIMDMTDSVTILRDGEKINTYRRDVYKKEIIIADMVGRKITNLFPERQTIIGKEVLSIENLTVEHPRIANTNIIENVSFNLRKNEVLGVAGLMGAGKSEMLNAIYGVNKSKSGRILKNGKEIKIGKIKDAIKNGLALVTEDRKKNGLLFLSCIKQNLTINNLRELSRFGFISRKKESIHANRFYKKMGVKASGIDTGVITLSGGNQQKVVIGKAINTEPEIILLDEPTKGVDVGSKNEIYQIINELVSKNVSIILVSSELPELMGMCDRIIVMANGTKAGEFLKAQVDEHKIMEIATQSKYLKKEDIQ